jgi:hypothetical protein
LGLVAACMLASGIGHAIAQETGKAQSTEAAKPQTPEGAKAKAPEGEKAKAAEAAKFQGMLIGSGKCKICHKTEKQGRQYVIWSESAHAKAYTTLASEAALAVAKQKGIADPQKAAECLACHATQAFLGKGVQLDPKGSYTDEEGVGCEACHGPGSEYKSMSVMKDRQKAIAAGLMIGDADLCVKCHNEKSPTYKEFKFEERWAQIAHPVPKGEE